MATNTLKEPFSFSSSKYFYGVPYLAIWLFIFFLLFYNEPEWGAGIYPVMALTLFPSSILDETGFEPTTF